MSIERVRDERYRESLVERWGEAQRDRDRLLGLVSVLGALLPGVPAVAAGLFGLAALHLIASYVASIEVHAERIDEVTWKLGGPLPRENRADWHWVLRWSNAATPVLCAAALVACVFGRG